MAKLHRDLNAKGLWQCLPNVRTQCVLGRPQHVYKPWIKVHHAPHQVSVSFFNQASFSTSYNLKTGNQSVNVRTETACQVSGSSILCQAVSAEDRHLFWNTFGKSSAAVKIS